MEVLANPDPYDLHYQLGEKPLIGENVDLEFGTMVYQEGILGGDLRQESLFSQALGIFKLDIGRYEGEQKALYYIKYLLNYLLWFVSFILLVLTIYAFYLYMVGSDDKAFGKVKSTLKVVVIVVLVLGLSWLIVSFMFNIYEKQLYADPALSYLFFNSFV